MTLGARELGYPADYLKELETRANFPILAANVYYNGDLLFPASTIKTMENLRIGLVGLSPDSTSEEYTIADSTITVEDPIESAERIVPDIRSQSDVLIVIGQMSDDVRDSLLSHVDGIDVLVQGRPLGHLAVPQIKYGARVVAPGSRGIRLGELILHFDDRTISSYHGRLIPLDTRVGSNRKVEAMVSRFNTERHKMLRDVRTRLRREGKVIELQEE